MEDLAQVTVYALYLWLAASLLWMWRSVLRNRRARKLATDHAESEGESGETLTDQDEMMSTVSTKTDSTSSSSTSATSTDSSNVDLRSESVSANSSSPVSTSTAGSTNSADSTAGSLEKANAKLAMASTASEPKSDARLSSLPEGPATSAYTTQKRQKDSSPKESEQPKSDKPESSQPATVAPPPQPDRPSTIADHLGGIRLPYDLLPMVPNGEKASNQRVSLVSDGAQPEVVGAAIADELERLGYSIKTLATDEAVAVRENQTLGLQIYPDASELSNRAGLRFPEAVAGSVAIDLWIK